MKKTLIALTLAALPVASMADVILYGQIKGGVEVEFKTKENGEKIKGSTTQIVDYGSRIGFKGHEQLNNNLKAIWQLEQKVDIAGGATGKNGVNGFGTRDSFIGLSGDSLGTIKAGYLSTPIKENSDRLDAWNYSNSVVGLGTFTRGNDANKRAVAVSYTTPNMGGFSATAYVSPSDNNTRYYYDANDIAKKDERDSALYGVSANYENNGFFADVAGVYVKNGVGNDTGRPSAADPNKWIKRKKGYQALAQVGYETDNVLAGVAYQRSHHVDKKPMFPGDDGYGYDVANEVAATVAVRANEGLRLKGTAAYGFKISDAGGQRLGGNGKYYQGIVGADYALSKRTEVNGQVGYLRGGKKEQKNEYGVVGVGLKHKF